MENSIGYRGTSHLKYVRLRQSLSRTGTAGIGRPTKKERSMIEKLEKPRF
jgi:hypothetical protein